MTEERLIQFGRDLKPTIENVFKGDKMRIDVPTENNSIKEQPQRQEKKNSQIVIDRVRTDTIKSPLVIH